MSDLFDLAAKIILDDSSYNKGVAAADKKGHGLASSIAGSMGAAGKAVGKGLASAAKMTGKAIMAAGTAAAAITGMAVKSYADYEQLVGGVDTLFKDSSEKVQEYAANAYQSAGLSANEYMETVTSFSASLLQSLEGDTNAAAEAADKAITDMSDNANKMGTDMEMIQNAYRGFAKGNFTMLDNLSLGYGGTKEEMQRLLDKAQELSGVEYDLSSYADIVDAIHVVQGEMGISGRTAEEVADIYERTGRTVAEQLGTTAKEAASTISGSVGMVKASFKNLMTGVADDNADFGKLMSEFVGSVSIAAGNILPRVQIALEGVGELVAELFPVIMEQIPELVSETLPSLVESGASILTSLIDGISENQELIVETTMELISTIGSTVVELLPQIIIMGADLLRSLIQGLAQDTDSLAQTIMDLVSLVITTTADLLPDIIQAGTDMLMSLIAGISEHPDEVVDTAIQIVETLATSLIDNLPKLASAAVRMVGKLVASIVERLPDILSTGEQIVDKIKEGIGNVLVDIVWAGHDIVQAIMDGIREAWDGLVSWFTGLWDDLFGNRDVNVNVNESSGVSGSHASGLQYVPYNGYVARLHEGERVLTKRESEQYDGKGPKVQVVQNIYARAQTAADLQQEALYQQQKAVTMRV